MRSNFDIIKSSGCAGIIIDCLDKLMTNKLANNYENINEIILEIPILKSLFATYHIITNIKDRIFFRKFIEVLLGISKFSSEEKSKFFNKLENNKKLEIKLIENIDKVEEEEKIDLMINILKKYINDIITKEQFFRYIKILLNLSFVDIEYLKNNTEYIGKDEETYTLVSENLIMQQRHTWAELQGDLTPEILKARKYIKTVLGENFLKAIK